MSKKTKGKVGPVINTGAIDVPVTGGAPVNKGIPEFPDMSDPAAMFGEMNIQHDEHGNPFLVEGFVPPVQNDPVPTISDTDIDIPIPETSAAPAPVKKPIVEQAPAQPAKPAYDSLDDALSGDTGDDVRFFDIEDDADQLDADDEAKGLVKFWNSAFDRIDAIKQRFAARSAAKAADPEKSATVAERLQKLKDAFKKGHEEASVDRETGEPSRSRKVLGTCAAATCAAFKWSGTKLGHTFSSFVAGARGAWDSYRMRHGKDASEVIGKRFSDEAILTAAGRVTNADERLRQALDVVHQHGYITAGGEEFMQDLAYVDRLKSRGYSVQMPATVDNVAIPGSVGDKLNVTVRINDYAGSASAAEPVSQDKAVDSIASSIREDLGDGAKRGQSALVDETVTAMAHIRAGYDALQKIAEREDLPDEFKQFLHDTMPQWSAQLEAQDKTVGARLRDVSGLNTPAPAADPKRVAAAAAIVDDAEETDIAFDDISD